jgi:peptidoglycan/xylan/chitin deacetylase (PgdA/CDA1 family)
MRLGMQAHRAADRVSPAHAAGTPAATVPTPAGWSPTTAASSTTADYYGDDLPFWLQVRDDRRHSLRPQLVVPYTLDCNDMRFALPQGFSHGDQFFEYLRDTFDVLYAEGDRAHRR